MARIQLPALLIAGATVLTLAGCVPEVAAPQPTAPPTPTPTVAAPESVRPAARVALSCEQLVPTATSSGLGDAMMLGIVDLAAATTAQAGWTWCSWGSPGEAHLEMIVIPDGPVDGLWNEPCGQFPGGPGCSAQIAVESTVISVSAMYPGMSLADADEAFGHIVENVAAHLQETAVAPAITVQRTLPQGAVGDLDPVTAAAWFGVDPEGDIPPGVPQEILGDTAYTQTASETAAWGDVEGAWAQVDLLPGGGWAAAEFLGAEATPLQEPSSFEPVEVAGLADAALETSGSAFTLCGAIGTDLVCMSSYGVPEDVFLAGVVSVVAELAGSADG